MGELEFVRNLGIVAHIDAGKTTLSERILFRTGVERRMGAVHAGTTALDWMPEERRRGISITAAVTTVPWRDHVVHMIDTPGHVDFTVEVERSLRVLDGAVLVISALAGVQAQSEAVWRQARRHRVPGIVFINQCDRQGADFLRALADLRRRLGLLAVPVALPIREGPQLGGVVDLIARRAWVGEPGSGAHTEAAVPLELADEVELLRAELFEALAEHDDRLLAVLVDEREPEEALVRSALRRATLAGLIAPVLCGSALLDVGIDGLLDAIIEYLPSPRDRGDVHGALPGGGRGYRAPSVDQPLCALAFKFLRSARTELVLVRLYSGWLRVGDELVNPRNGAREVVGGVYRVHADSFDALPAAGAGDIVALAGCRATGTGDTLCAPGSEIALEGLVLPEPVMSLAVEPVAEAQRDALRAALAQFEREDPTLHVRDDPETGQWIVSGMGELHLDVLARRLDDEFGLTARFGRPRVTYREAPLGRGQGHARVERAMGAGTAWAEVELDIEPHPASEGVDVELGAELGLCDQRRAEVEAALRQGAQVGPREGGALGRARIVVQRVRTGLGKADGGGGEELLGDAARVALQSALAGLDVEVREPIMAFEVDSPAEVASQVMSSLLGHRAEIAEVRSEGNQTWVRGTVPLAGLFGYASLLRSASQGRAVCSLAPAGSRAVERPASARE